MEYSKLALTIEESPTLALDAKAKGLIAQGFSVMNLGGGEPKSPAPKSAIDAAIKKLNENKIKYTPVAGTVELRKAVAKQTLEDYGLEIKNTNVLISSGAKQALYNFLFSVINEGDEVIIPVPYWVSYPEMVKMCLGKPVLVRPKTDDLTPDFEDIKNSVTSKTKVIIVNSPNNPSGTVYEDSLIEKIVKLCEEKDIFLVMDDIYRKLVYGAKSPASVFKYTKSLKNVVVINGVSKAYGMTGFRIGWAIADEKLVSLMAKIQAQITSCPSDLTQAASAAALNDPDQSGVSSLVAELKANRDILLGEVKKLSKAKFKEPQGTFYTFIDFSAYNKNSEELANQILEKVLVSAVPGDGFGMPGYLRISCCGSKEDILEGMRRIIWFLDPSQGPTIEIGGKTINR